MKKMKKIQLRRETVCALTTRNLGDAAAGFSDPTNCQICTLAPNCNKT